MLEALSFVAGVLSTFGFFGFLIMLAIILALVRASARLQSNTRATSVWKQFATEIGGTLIEGNLLRGPRVEGTIQGWPLTLEHFTRTIGATHNARTYTYTRMVVENVGADLLQLTVFRRGGYLDDPTGPLFLSTRSSLLGEFFGQDIEVGDPQFDRLFVVRSNDAGRTQRLLANAKIRDLIQAQPSITVNLQPEEVGPCVLSLEDRETLGDLVLLRAWYALLDEILTELFRKV